jgi:tRNA dimethylallyltransferase
MSESLDICFVIGCTGCGKGAVGRELAGRVGGEILSVDSMKIYRRMDIGTAKPSEEVLLSVPHHLVDIVEPSERFSVAQFVTLAERTGGEIAARGRPIFAVGGTAMYIKALSEGLFEGPSADPEIRRRLREEADSSGADVLHDRLRSVDSAAAERIHRNDLRRIVRALEVFEITGTPITELQTQWDQTRTRHRCTFIGLRRTLEDQSHRTNMRVKRLIERGWVEEVRQLLAEGAPMSTTARQALGYPEMIDYVRGVMSLEDAVERIKISTRRFSKAQRTWFKRFRDVYWVDLEPDDDVASVCDRIAANLSTICFTRPR